MFVSIVVCKNILFEVRKTNSLVQAFYSGALTMFFASPPKLPFNNLRDAINHKEWKMFILKEEYR